MKIRIGISACLLGRAVRYDGGDKRDAGLIETLGPHVEWMPVCPEVECGLPVPREPMHLVGPAAAPRLVTVSSGLDHTAQLLSWACGRAAEVQTERLSGFIFKARSPSCGLAAVPLQSPGGSVEPVGVGLWPRVFREAFPQLPVEDEVGLRDVLRRNRFLARARAAASSV